MRIASETIFRQALTAMQQNQGTVAKLQQQLATGDRVMRAGEDPAAFSTSQRMDSRLSALDAFDRAGARVQHRLSLSENRMVEAGEVLNRTRELLLQGGNATMSAGDRALLAIELEQLRESMLVIANGEDGEGNALFAGTMPPPAYVMAPGGTVEYNGNTMQRLVGLNENQTIADGDSGPSVFGAGPDDVFTVIDDALAALAEPDNALRGAAVEATLSRLDDSLGVLNQSRARIGARLNAIEQSVELRDAERLQLKTARSALRDTDFAEAITAFTQASARLSAAQQSYLQVQQRSLFDLLR